MPSKKGRKPYKPPLYQSPGMKPGQNAHGPLKPNLTPLDPSAPKPPMAQMDPLFAKGGKQKPMPQPKRPDFSKIRESTQGLRSKLKSLKNPGTDKTTGVDLQVDKAALDKLRARLAPLRDARRDFPGQFSPKGEMSGKATGLDLPKNATPASVSMTDLKKKMRDRKKAKPSGAV